MTVGDGSSNEAARSARGLPRLQSQYAVLGKAHWVKRHDTATGKLYYFNTDTGESQWERPPDLPHERRGTVAHAFHHPHEVAAVDEARLREVEDANAKRAAASGVWVKRIAEDSHRPYYFNTQTQTSQWERPTAFGHRRGTVVQIFKPTPVGKLHTVKTVKRVKRRGKRRVMKKVLVKKSVPADVAALRAAVAQAAANAAVARLKKKKKSQLMRKKLKRAVQTSGLVSAFSRRWSIKDQTDWEKRLDPKTHHFFYFNAETGESRWHLPETGEEESATDAAAAAAAEVAFERAAAAENAAVAASCRAARAPLETSEAVEETGAMPMEHMSRMARDRLITEEAAREAETRPIAQMLLSPPLDDVWEERRDSTTGRIVYVHRTTAERVWDRPPPRASNPSHDAPADDHSTAAAPTQSSARVEGAAASGDAAAAPSDTDGGSALAESATSTDASAPLAFSAAPPPMQCTLSAPSDTERQSLVAAFEQRRRDACPYLQPLAAVTVLGVADADVASSGYALAVSFDSAGHFQSVAQDLSSNGPVREGEAARLAQCVLRALLYLHLSARTARGKERMSDVAILRGCAHGAVRLSTLLCAPRTAWLIAPTAVPAVQLAHPEVCRPNSTADEPSPAQDLVDLGATVLGAVGSIHAGATPHTALRVRTALRAAAPTHSAELLDFVDACCGSATPPAPRGSARAASVRRLQALLAHRFLHQLQRSGVGAAMAAPTATPAARSAGSSVDAWLAGGELDLRAACVHAEDGELPEDVLSRVWRLIAARIRSLYDVHLRSPGAAGPIPDLRRAAVWRLAEALRLPYAEVARYFLDGMRALHAELSLRARREGG